MKQKLPIILTLLGFCFFVVMCGGNGDSARLYFLALDLTEEISAGSALAVGDTGSSINSNEVHILKLELQRDDDSWVTVYEGNEYLETVGTGVGTIAGMIEGVMPDIGNYVGIRLTSDGVRRKVKIIKDGIAYYSLDQLQVLDSGEYWAFSNTEADYGVIDISTMPAQIISIQFPAPLEVLRKNDVNLVYANEWTGEVLYRTDDESDDVDRTINAHEPDIVATFLPDIPVIKVQFEIIAEHDTQPDLSNIITFFFDATGQFIGGHSARLSEIDHLINGGWFRSGQVNNIENGGNKGDFDVNFHEGGFTGGYYNITGSYDCGIAGIGEYTGLTVSAYNLEGTFDLTGYTLNTSGEVFCTDIPQG